MSSQRGHERVLLLLLALSASCVAGGRFKRGPAVGHSAAPQEQQAQIPPELEGAWRLGACPSELQSLSFKYARNEYGVVTGRGRVEVDDYLALADCLREEGVASGFAQKNLLRTSRKFYRRVLELDPNYVYAMHGIASIYLFLARETRMSFFKSLKEDYREHLVKAAVPLQEALRSDPNHPMTYYYLAQIKILRGDWDAARKRFAEMAKKGRTIGRRMSDFHAWSGFSHEMVDNRPEAKRGYEKAVEADETLDAADWAWEKIRQRSWHVTWYFLGQSLVNLPPMDSAELAAVHERNDLHTELSLGYFFTKTFSIEAGVRLNVALRDETTGPDGNIDLDVRIGPHFRIGDEPEGLHLRAPFFVRVSGPAIGIAPGVAYALRASRYSEHSAFTVGMDFPVGVSFDGDPLFAATFVLGWHWYY